MWIALIVTAMVATIAVTAVLTLRNAAPDERSARPLAPGISQLGLTEAQINDAMGTTDIKLAGIYSRLIEDDLPVEPPACRPVFSAALWEVYRDSDFVAVAANDYQQPSVRYFSLRVAVFALRSSKAAKTVLDKTIELWQTCKAGPFKYAPDPATWSIDELAADGVPATVDYRAQDTDVRCQRAVGISGAYVIDVGACTDRDTNGPRRIAQQLIELAEA